MLNNPDITTDVIVPKVKPKKGFMFWLKTISKIILFAHLIFIFLIAIFSVFYINAEPPYTVLMLYRQGFKAKKPSFIELNKVSNTFQLDLLNLEDGQFREHYGIDMEAIKKAKEKNDKLGYKAYGGSTITQQLARTLFLLPNKTYFRKYLEAIIALELELFLGKDRILELYINYAELGKGIYGFNDAALFYYKKPLPKTTEDEKIRLMTILASPINYTPTTYYKNKALSARYKFIYKYHHLH